MDDATKSAARPIWLRHDPQGPTRKASLPSWCRRSEIQLRRRDEPMAPPRRTRSRRWVAGPHRAAPGANGCAFPCGCLQLEWGGRGLLAGDGVTGAGLGRWGKGFPSTRRARAPEGTRGPRALVRPGPSSAHTRRSARPGQDLASGGAMIGGMGPPKSLFGRRTAVGGIPSSGSCCETGRAVDDVTIIEPTQGPNPIFWPTWLPAWTVPNGKLLAKSRNPLCAAVPKNTSVPSAVSPLVNTPIFVVICLSTLSRWRFREARGPAGSY